MAKRNSRRDFLKLAAMGAVTASTGPFFLREAWAMAPIKIGHVNTFSGPLAALGEQGRWGLTVAVNRINNAGGINGQQDSGHRTRRRLQARAGRA